MKQSVQPAIDSQVSVTLVYAPTALKSWNETSFENEIGLIQLWHLVWLLRIEKSFGDKS